MKDTMTVIELLNKIANKEEIPKKIKYGFYEYEWVLDANDSKWGYARRLEGCCMIPFKHDLDLSDWETLNSTVIILECDESIKELKMLNCTGIDFRDPFEVTDVTKDCIIADIQTLQKWVNKIIKKNKQGGQIDGFY